jgi:putative DNA primase/helicase
MKFVDQVMGGDKELMAYLQRICGYAMTGLIREHALFFFYGEGNNGKSTFLTTIHNMFGEYGGRASRGLLFRARNDKHPTSMATLHGKRFVVAPEIGENDEVDEPVTKDLTGGDPINARRMREDEWVFNPTHKLFLAGNHKPKISGTDKGIWRRLRVIPWTVTIPADQINTALPDTLKKPEILAGVLTWCVQGCLAWQKKGLGEPPAVITATDDYRKEQDMLGQFFAERLVFTPGARMGRALLRETYVTWCQELGLHEFGYRRFTQALQKQGVTDCNYREGSRTLNGWAGVRLAEPGDIAKRKLAGGSGQSIAKPANDR